MNGILYLRQIKEQLKTFNSNATNNFSNIKSVLSTLTNKVINVQGGVDNNTTALNTIKQEVNSVKGSVVETKKAVNNIQRINGREVRKSIEKSNTTVDKTLKLYSVSGKGKLIGLYFYFDEDNKYSGTLSITVDGIKHDIVLGSNFDLRLSLVSREYIRGDGKGITIDGKEVVVDYSSWDFNQVMELPTYAPSETNYFLAYNCIDFSSSLEISYTPNKSDHYKRLELTVLYILE